MPEAAFVIAPGTPARVRELADTLIFELERQGVPGSVHGDFPPPRPDRVPVLVDPAGHVAVTGRELPDDGTLRRTVMICEEPLPQAEGHPDWARLRRAGAVFALDATDRARMVVMGVPARLLRPGYSESLDRFAASNDRPVDITFIGVRSPRRERLLEAAAPVLDRHSCRVELLDDGHGDTEPRPAGSRAELLAQSRIAIYLHREEGQRRLPWRDVVDAIHAGAAVVSEHSSGIAPLVGGEHLLVAGPHAVPYLADVLLRDPARLASLRGEAYARLREWLPYALPVSVLRAAIVELVGEPDGPVLHRTTASGG